jgi:hypothetical protein
MERMMIRSILAACTAALIALGGCATNPGPYETNRGELPVDVGNSAGTNPYTGAPYR